MKRKLKERVPRRRKERRRRRRPPKDEVRTWLVSAQEAMEEGDLERVFAIARRLHARRCSAGFEVEALAHLEGGAREEALEVLERGLRLFRDVWSMWQLYGNALSEVGRYAEAHAAYDQALACPSPERDSLDLNRAVLLEREGRWEESLALMEPLRTFTLGGRLVSVRAICLTRLGRSEEARELLRSVLAEDERKEELEPGCRAALLGHFAQLSLEAGEREAAREAAFEAHWLERGHPHALWCLRELEGARDPAARRYRLALRGELPEPLHPGDPPTGFCTMTSVVARDLDDALARSLAFEPAELRGSVVLEEHEDVEAAPDEPLGVCFVSRYALFRLDL